MKKNIYYTLWLLAPMSLWAQAEGPAATEIDLSDVIIVEDTSSGETSDAAAVEVVEIPDRPIEGVSVDLESPTILEVAESLPTDMEIVLELPGPEVATSSEATLATEETISVDFPDEDVRTILRNVADLFELNLVIPDTLQGRTSIKLRNITWRQAFEVVLEPIGFTYVEDRNIIRVKSLEDLSTEPVDTRVFVANYARAEDLQGSIEPLVDTTTDGRIQVDKRSNALVITERPSRMNKIQEIIERLDQATDQVMIESKFIEVSQTDQRRIGVDWAFLDEDPNSLFGGNGSFINNIADDETGSFVNPIGLTEGNAARGLLAVFSRQEFGAVVQALDDDNSSKLVSQPTVVVMNNRSANFEVGVDYPIRELTYNIEQATYESGELVKEFIGVKLDVTPSVNNQGMISLSVEAELSEIGGAGFPDTVANPAGGADPVISKRSSKTDVTIKDGFTIALGGLVSNTKSDGERGLPFLRDVPVVGNLFQTKTNDSSRSNLIIFITASTLNPDGTTYREIIDPRVLDAVGHTDSQSPGYVLPEDDMRVLLGVEAIRQSTERNKMIRDLRAE